jgi:hypothetical protein
VLAFRIDSFDSSPGHDTTFVVHAQCGPPGEAPTSSQDYTFTLQLGLGIMPFTGYGVPVDPGDRCKVTETDAGGATSVGYSCSHFDGSPTLQPCLPGGQEVQFGDVPDESASIDIDNEFLVAPAPPIPEPTPPRFPG